MKFLVRGQEVLTSALARQDTSPRCDKNMVSCERLVQVPYRTASEHVHIYDTKLKLRKIKFSSLLSSSALICFHLGRWRLCKPVDLNE